MLNLNSSATYFVAEQQRRNPLLHFHNSTDTFVLLTAASSPATIKRELLRFYGNDAYVNAPE
jgi:hypothetical protein